MKMSNHQSINSLFLLVFSVFILALSCNKAQALTDQPKYKIEVLVIKPVTDSSGTEKWPSWQHVVAARVKQAQEMPGRITRYIANTENSELSQLVSSLTETGEYIILDHRAWYQQADTRSQSPAAYYESRYENIGMLQGQVQFYMSRFLHLNVNLNLVPDQYEPERTIKEGIAEDDSLQPVYTIEQGKRVKSEAYYYFDHPQFGAIVYIKPI